MLELQLRQSEVVFGFVVLKAKLCDVAKEPESS